MKSAAYAQKAYCLRRTIQPMMNEDKWFDMNEKRRNVAPVLTLAVSVFIAVSSICSAADSAAVNAPGVSSAVAPYQTQLFNLVMNKRSLVDGKNHYQKSFDQRFDAMLASSTLAKQQPSTVSLKKRLLSGPQPDAVLVRDKRSGHEYVVYQACQAHACDATSLAVLYAPDSQAMSGRLNMHGKVEYLGNPGNAEKNLLDASVAKL